MKIKRKELLNTLQRASVGLSSREILEQSNSFIFDKGNLYTFNDEIFFKCDVPLDFTASVVAEDLIKILSKFPDKEIDISKRDKEIVVEGKRKSAGLICYSKINLPFESIPQPEKWSNLNEDIQSTLIQAARTCGIDQTQYLTTCVHMADEYIEACDNYRFFRARISTGIKNELLIPASSIEALKNLSLKKISIGKGWCYFSTEEKELIAIRCSHEKYHENIKELFKLKNPEKIFLPNNLSNVVERAGIMNEPGYDARITLSIRKNRLTITSRKDSGWYKEKKRIKYNGRSLHFSIHTESLIEVLKRTQEVTIGNDKMKLEMDNIQMIIVLNKEEGKD